MGENLFKTITTVAIWIILGGISLSAIFMSDYGLQFGEALVICMTLIVGTVATAAIWDQFRNSDSKKQVETTQDIEKLKRGTSGNSRLALLMELMDADEREVFKDTLKQRVLDEATYSAADGESLSLESLLDDDAHYRRHQR